MASGSNDDTNQRKRSIDRSQPTRGTSSGPGAPRARTTSSGDDVDFGAFVSERVRSASERLKGSDVETPGPVSDAPPTAVSKPAGPTPMPTPARRERPSRYWRDSLKQTTGEEVEPVGESTQRFLGAGASRRRPAGEQPGEDDGGDDGGGPWWASLMGSDDDDGGRRRLLLLALIGLVVLALIIFGITRLLGGDENGGGDGNPTPAPTVAAGDDETPTSTPTTPQGPGIGTGTEADPTETPEIRRGGDNQLAPPGDDEGTPAGSRIDYESEVARSCTGECLVRLIDAEATEVLQETGNRPSFVGGDVAWLVVSPDEAEELDGKGELALVANDPQTYNLYVITAPQGSVDPATAAEYGEVVDAIGVHSLLAFDVVPAPVKGLLEAGYEVNKLAPAPPLEIAAKGDRPAIANVAPDALMGAVDAGNLTRTITDLSSTGELDSSGLGTRYYALPGNQIAADYLFQELESYGLRVWYEDFVSWDGLLLVNVVAEAPGQDDSESFAVMSHFDSFSTSNPRQAPGADDNSTGMAVNLETARILAGYELEHPVRFVFVNAEEVGIQGALAWSRRANAEGINVQGVLNVDSIGSARQGGYVVTNAGGSSTWLQDLLSDVNDEHGLGQVMQHLQNPEIIADDDMVRQEGIDAVMIARELYGWTPFHHTADDTMANVSIGSVETMTYLTLLSVVRLAG